LIAAQIEVADRTRWRRQRFSFAGYS